MLFGLTTSAAAPAVPFTLLLDLHYHFKATVAQKHTNAITHIFWIRDAGGNDVDHAEHLWGDIGRMMVMVMVVVVVVVIVIMIVIVVMMMMMRV